MSANDWHGDWDIAMRQLRKLGERMVLEAYTVDVACQSGAAHELEFYGGQR